VAYNQKDWDDHLDAAEFAYNNSVQASTGFSPFYLNTGQHPHLPLSEAVKSANINPNPTAADMIKQISDDLDKAKQNLIAAQKRQKRYADESRRDLQFSVGDKVMLSTAHINNADRAPKLSPKYIGPFTVARVVNGNAYVLDLPPTMKMHSTFNVSQLKPYRDGATQFPDRVQEIYDRPPPEVIDSQTGQDAWEVDHILAKRMRGRTTEYLVKWKGYPHWENTWEPVRSLRLAPDALKSFESNDRA
jgi:hypothetical protein